MLRSNLYLLALIIFILFSCKKDKVSDFNNTYVGNGDNGIYGYYEYAYFKGSVTDSLGNLVSDRMFVLRYSPCLIPGGILNGFYHMSACQRIGRKMPYSFPDSTTLDYANLVYDTIY